MNEDTLIAYEVVKPPLRAWHAGISQWGNYTGLNDWSIGIEINMPNYAHADAAPWRNTSGSIEIAKTDPGPTLPWKALAKNNIGVWPAESCPDSVKTNLTASKLQELLANVGYNVHPTGIYDLPTNLSIGAA